MSPASRTEVQAALRYALSVATDPLDVFRDLDPLDAEFCPALVAGLQNCARGLWGVLVREFPETPAAQLLVNAAAEASRDPSKFALLCIHGRSGEQNEPKFVAAAARLSRLCPKIASDDPLALAILAASNPREFRVPPDISAVFRLKPGVRLRYALAHTLRSGAPAVELFDRARSQRRSTDYLRVQELIRTLEASWILKLQTRLLGETEAFFLPSADRALLLGSPRLRELALPRPLRDQAAFEKSISENTARCEEIQSKLVEVDVALCSRDFAEASRIIELLDSSKLTGILGSRWWTAQAHERVQRAPVRGVLDQGGWEPLSRSAISRLKGFNRAIQLTEWWGSSASSIAQALTSQKLEVRTIDRRTLRRLLRSWADIEHLQFTTSTSLIGLIPVGSSIWGGLSIAEFVTVGIFHPKAATLLAPRLAELNDASAVLALFVKDSSSSRIRRAVTAALRLLPTPVSWGAWIISCLGTETWSKAESLAARRLDVPNVAIDFLVAGGTPLDPTAFHLALLDRVCRLGLSRVDPLGRCHTIRRFVDRYPDCLPTLLERIRFERLEPVLIQREVASEPIDRFLEQLWGSKLHPELRAAVWRIRLVRASSIKRLKSLLLEEGVRQHEIPWNERWLGFEGPRRELATVLVLAARRAPQQLYSLSAVLGVENLTFGLRSAAACLPRGDRRDIGFLELAAELGPETITRLAAVLAMTDKSAVAGHRLDRTYARYLLPKQSGGSRTISVPNPIVKIIQRSILDRLLNELGAHECAYGFVPRRSIKDNAFIHVGRPVVANIDIQNCFPSVRWQLVLGVLRRDLAHRLSPGAISLLVDICTAEGGLPIGAPTSPALLNRVLLRTDQILVAAAEKLGSKYTRYADDLTFSGDHSAVHLLGIAKRTLSQIGLQIDPGKTSIYRPGRRQIVTGLVVNEKVNIPRRLRRRIRAAVHAVENGRVPHWNHAPESVESLRGRLAFSQGINPEQAGPLVRRLAGAPIAIEADRDPPEGRDDG